MRIGIVVFPGTWSDEDCHMAFSEVLGVETTYVWHKDTDLSDIDCVVLPGGFSYGDYLRTGAIARFSPVMESVLRFGKSGKPVIGICNGFQILCESWLLPGVLMRNDCLEFRCEWTNLRVETNNTIFSNKAENDQILKIPVSHGEGRFFIDNYELEELEMNKQILFRYSSSTGDIRSSDNPNGSLNNIAGITNKEGNVLGMMPHPERACKKILGSDDGLIILESIINSLKV